MESVVLIKSMDRPSVLSHLRRVLLWSPRRPLPAKSQHPAWTRPPTASPAESTFNSIMEPRRIQEWNLRLTKLSLKIGPSLVSQRPSPKVDTDLTSVLKPSPVPPLSSNPKPLRKMPQHQSLEDPRPPRLLRRKSKGYQFDMVGDWGNWLLFNWLGLVLFLRYS